MTITSSQYILVMWSLALYLVESFPSLQLKSPDASSASFSTFVTRILSIAVSHVSGSEEMTPWPIFRQLVKGLERLLLLSETTSRLSPEIRQTLTAVSLEKAKLAGMTQQQPHPALPPRRGLAAVAMLLSTMYSNESLPVFPSSNSRDHDDMELNSRHFFDADTMGTVDKNPNDSTTSVDSSGSTQAVSDSTPLNPSVPIHMQSSDPEALVAAMEKTTVLFDNLRKSSAFEANVLSNLLPNFLLDFFQPQDIMNKLIGEFLSNQQPHPQLLARCLFRLFGRLIADGRGSGVTDWVAISLGNVVARTPVSMATWSLTVCFVSASNDVWLRRTFPLILDRVGLLEEMDKRLFGIAAKNFYRGITDVGDKNAFRSAFQRHRDAVEHYDQLLTELERDE